MNVMPWRWIMGMAVARSALAVARIASVCAVASGRVCDRVARQKSSNRSRSTTRAAHAVGLPQPPREAVDQRRPTVDPAMIERARANADRPGNRADPQPSFPVGDVASFADASFDLVVSTLSLHHWADPSAGLAEIGRVLRPGARALVWDLRPGIVPFHARLPDPVAHTQGSPLRVVSATRWRWPWGFSLTQRIELVRADAELEPAT